MAGWSSDKNKYKVNLQYNGFSVSKTSISNPSGRHTIGIELTLRILKKLELSLNSGTGFEQGKEWNRSREVQILFINAISFQINTSARITTNTHTR